MMDSKLKGFDKVCESLDFSPTDKAAAKEGAKLFFERGWPSSCFTVPMAIAASNGQLPQRYRREQSRTLYEYRTLGR